MIFLLRLLARLPLPVLHVIGVGLGWLIYWSPGRHSARMRHNLFASGLCEPGRDCKRLLHQTIAEIGKAIIELLPVWLRPYDEVLNLVKGTSGWERIDAARAAGKGVILLSPHIGCFEIISLYCAARHPFTAMYKPPRNALITQLMLIGRQRGLPLRESGGARLRLIAGTAFGLTSPVRTLSPLFYAHLELQAGATFELPTVASERTIYVVDRAVVVDGTPIAGRSLAVVRTGASPLFEASGSCTLMPLGGEPVGPRFAWWNFVSSRRERIEQAKQDWAAGRIPLPPMDASEWIPLPDGA